MLPEHRTEEGGVATAQLRRRTSAIAIAVSRKFDWMKLVPVQISSEMMALGVDARRRVREMATAAVVDAIGVVLLHRHGCHGNSVVEPGRDKHWIPRFDLVSWKEALLWCVECRGQTMKQRPTSGTAVHGKIKASRSASNKIRGEAYVDN